MIELTRLNGSVFWLNPHEIEHMEARPDTTIVLLSGNRIIVQEPPSEVVDRIVAYRKRIGSLSDE